MAGRLSTVTPGPPADATIAAADTAAADARFDRFCALAGIPPTAARDWRHISDYPTASASLCAAGCATLIIPAVIADTLGLRGHHVPLFEFLWADAALPFLVFVLFVLIWRCGPRVHHRQPLFYGLFWGFVLAIAIADGLRTVLQVRLRLALSLSLCCENVRGLLSVLQVRLRLALVL